MTRQEQIDRLTGMRTASDMAELIAEALAWHARRCDSFGIAEAFATDDEGKINSSAGFTVKMKNGDEYRAVLTKVYR